MQLGFDKLFTKHLKEEGGFKSAQSIMINFKKFLENENLKIKETVIKGEDLYKVVSENTKQVEKLFKEFELDLENKEKIRQFLNILVKSRLLLRFDRAPNDFANKKKLKWPKEMIIPREQIFGEKMFFYFTFKDKGTSMWAILIIGIIMMFLLFPLWPMKVKIVTFYASLYILIFLISFIFIRIFLYMFLRIFGVEFWILPEIFESDSFKPVVSCHRSEDKLFGYVFRLGLVSIFTIITYQIYNDPGTITDVTQLGSTGINELVKWGRVKLGADFDPTAHRKPYRSFAEEMIMEGLDKLDEEEEKTEQTNESQSDENTEGESKETTSENEDKDL